MVFFIVLIYKLFRFIILLQVIKYLYLNYNEWNYMNQLIWYVSLLILDFWVNNSIVYIESNNNNDE